MENKNLTKIIGERLKDLRTSKGLSLDKVAELTGVSKPMLGQIENGRSNPTVSTLWKIAEGLNVPFTTFIDEIKRDVTIVKEMDITPIKEANDLYDVYPVFPTEPNKPFEIYKVDLLSGCDYQAKAHPTGVEEYLWIFSGEITMRLDSQEYDLSQGEGIRFKADQLHSYINNSDSPASLVMVIYYSHHFIK